MTFTPHAVRITPIPQLYVWTEGCVGGHPLVADTSGNFDRVAARLGAIGRGLLELQVIDTWSIAGGEDWPALEESFVGDYVEGDERRIAQCPLADDEDHCGRYMAVLATAVARATAQDVNPLRTWMDDPPPDGERDPFDDEVREVLSRAFGVML